jgi:hypothetical protein
MAVNSQLFSQLVDAVSPVLASDEQRTVLVYKALLNSDVLEKLDFSGTPTTFSARLLGTLINRSEYESVLNLLQEAKAVSQPNKQAQFDQLIKHFNNADIDEMMSQDDIDDRISSVASGRLNALVPESLDQRLRAIIFPLTVFATLLTVFWLFTSTNNTENVLEGVLAVTTLIAAVITLFWQGKSI